MMKKAPKPIFHMKKFIFGDKKFNSEKEMLFYVASNKNNLYYKTSYWWCYLVFLLLLIFQGFMVALIITILWGIAIWLNKFIRNTNIDSLTARHYELTAREKKEESRRVLEYEKNQLKKGLFKFKNQWYSKEKVEKLKKEEIILKNKVTEVKNDIYQISSKKSFKKMDMKCKDCNYIWKIKKDRGIPAKCPSCNSKNISLEQLIKKYNKIYYLKGKINSL
jgi:rubrerythrin